jgi:hypothetical protein
MPAGRRGASGPRRCVASSAASPGASTCCCPDPAGAERSPGRRPPPAVPPRLPSPTNHSSGPHAATRSTLAAVGVGSSTPSDHGRQNWRSDPECLAETGRTLLHEALLGRRSGGACPQSADGDHTGSAGGRPFVEGKVGPASVETAVPRSAAEDGAIEQHLPESGAGEGRGDLRDDPDVAVRGRNQRRALGGIEGGRGVGDRSLHRPHECR